MVYNIIAVVVSILALIISTYNVCYTIRRNYSLDKKTEVNAVEKKIISFFLKNENDTSFLKSVNYEAKDILFSIEILLNSKRINTVCDSIYFYDFINLIESCEDTRSRINLNKFPKLRDSYLHHNLQMEANKYYRN